MIKYIVIRDDFRGTCSLFICRNAEGVHGKQRLATPALKVRSIKICRSLLRVPTMTALVLTFGAKAFNDTELRNACWAGWNTVVISTGEK